MSDKIPICPRCQVETVRDAGGVGFEMERAPTHVSETKWDTANVKEIQIAVNQFSIGKLVVNGVDVTENTTSFALTSVSGDRVELTVTKLVPGQDVSVRKRRWRCECGKVYTVPEAEVKEKPKRARRKTTGKKRKPKRKPGKSTRTSANAKRTTP